jgi:hypothetical protein
MRGRACIPISFGMWGTWRRSRRAGRREISGSRVLSCTTASATTSRRPRAPESCTSTPRRSCFASTPVLLLVILGLQLFWLGRSLSGRVGTGVITLAIALLVGDVSSLFGSTVELFGNIFVSNLYLSPTYLFGLVFLIPIVVVSGRWLIERSGGLPTPVIIGLPLLAGCFAKIMILPIVAAAAGSVLLWRVLVERTTPHRELGFLATVATATAILYPLVVDPNEIGSFRFRLLASLHDVPAWHREGLQWLVVGHSHAGLVLGIFLAHAPVVWLGLVCYLALRRLRVDGQAVWFGLVAGAAAAPSLALLLPGEAQLYFWVYGYAALVAVATEGLDLLIERPRGGLRGFRLLSPVSLPVSALLDRSTVAARLVLGTGPRTGLHAGDERPDASSSPGPRLGPPAQFAG